MTISSGIFKQLVQVLRDVSRDEILPRYRRLSKAEVQSKSSPSDLVTIADQRAEALISQRILDILPHAEIVGEEAVAGDPDVLDRVGAAQMAVIVDPIDGTWNYANGLPLFGVILAVVVEGKTVFGVLYDPVMDDWIEASQGNGAYYCSENTRKRLTPLMDTKPIAHMTGFFSTFLFDKTQQIILAPELARFDRVLSFRCSCHEYRLLGEGGLDFGVSGNLKPWDHAAGQLVHAEVGGYSAIIEDGSPYFPTLTRGHLLLAPSQKRWEEIQNLLKLSF